VSERKMAPSSALEKGLESLLGAESPEMSGGALLTQLVRMGAQRVIQEALEKEQEEHLSRGRYERRAEGAAPVYRNGYEPGRLLLSEGEIEVLRPQVRGGAAPYRSRLWELLSTRSEAVERLVVEMYARGLSTRDIEDLFRSGEGDVLLSRTSVSELTDVLWEEYEAFSARDLSDLPLAYLIVDGVYEAMRRVGHVRDGILVAWGILEDGRRMLLHLELGRRESYQCCLEFLRGMLARGLRAPVLVASDGAPGMIRAIEEAFPEALRQRCLVHKKMNVLGKVAEADQGEVRAFLDAVYLAPTPELARTLGAEFVSRYQKAYPAAVQCFLDDLEACLSHLRCPEIHRRAIRTTNIIERSFGELRRRTKVIPRFFTEKSCLKLAYAELVRAGQRSSRVKMSQIELRQIALLREQLNAERFKPRSTSSPRAARQTA
jgi:putative transposase